MTRKFLAPALAAMMALAGCNLTRSDLRQKADEVTATVFNTNAERPGKLVEPRYCKLDSAILARPAGDPIVAASAWNVADEQSIPIELRQALEANGLRVGVITGALPGDIVEAFKAKPPIKETQWVHIALPEGEHTPIVLGGKTESVSLLLNHRGKVDGRDYQGASGRINITPSHQGLYGVTIRMVPEVHHGADAADDRADPERTPRSPSTSSGSRTASRRTSSASWPPRSTSSPARPWSSAAGGRKGGPWGPSCSSSPSRRPTRCSSRSS